MKKIDLNTWKRKEHFAFFQTFEEPYFGVTAQVDVTQAQQYCAQHKLSFFLFYLHATLKAANEIENFKYRIDAQGQPYSCDQIDASATIMRPNETFGFSYMVYTPNFNAFAKAATAEIERVKASEDLFPPFNPDHVIHCSALPWLDFTAITHSRAYSRRDSVPKISYGRVTDTDGKKQMSVAVFSHHGLIDGLHVSRFFKDFQELLSHPSH